MPLLRLRYSLGPVARRSMSQLVFRPVLLGLVVPILLTLAAASARAEGQIQLGCNGTLLQARGQAELKRAIELLKLSLSLEAEAATADGALASLQARLDAVRQALQQLGVRKLEVTSPSTWTRSPEPKKPALTTASLQVSGELAPAQLQRLIRQVGSLPGVRLSPVDPRAQTSGDAASQARLLKAAYGDALGQAKTIAAAIGLHQLRPLEVEVDGGGGAPIRMRASMAYPDSAPFDPAELPEPVDRLSLLVRFCAR